MPKAIRLGVAEDILTANPGLAAIFCSNESGSIGDQAAAECSGIALDQRDLVPFSIDDCQISGVAGEMRELAT